MGFPPRGYRASRAFPIADRTSALWLFRAQDMAEPRPGPQRRWIVDIAADRFGADPVIVTPACAPRYGTGECDTAFAGFIAARRRTVDALWPVWRARRAGR